MTRSRIYTLRVAHVGKVYAGTVYIQKCTCRNDISRKGPHHDIPGEVHVGKVPVASSAGHDRPADPPHAQGNGSPRLHTSAGSGQHMLHMREATTIPSVLSMVAVPR